MGPPDETHGEVKGFSLVYSGNFLVETELSEMSRLRVNMGIHPMGLQWNLKRGELLEGRELCLGDDTFLSILKANLSTLRKLSLLDLGTDWVVSVVRFTGYFWIG